MSRLFNISFLVSISIVASASAQSYPAKTTANARPPTITATVCPWLTEGSAAAALGGSVRVSLNIASDTEGTCTFTRKDAPQSQLKIVVGAANIPLCPSGSAHVAGIGTQANRCHLPPSPDVSGEMISGKVRTVTLAVTFTGVAKPPSTAAGYPVAVVGIDQIAEQVAGNLF